MEREGVFCVLVMRLRFNVGHFVAECEEFMWRRRQLVRKTGRMEGAERWVEEYERGEREVKVALLLGKRLKDTNEHVMDRIDGCLLEELLGWWRRQVNELMGWHS